MNPGFGVEYRLTVSLKEAETWSSESPFIPGSDWLPNVGFGQLEDLWADYLHHYAHQWDGMIIFYCTLTAGIRGIQLKEWLRNGLNWS